MKLLDLTLATPAENLALDEALLEQAESAAEPLETLRLWEPAGTLVVVGRSSQVRGEVNVEACQADQVPILRRASGGAAIVAGRGCLMYAAVLSYELRPQLRSLDAAHRFALDTLTAAASRFAPGVARRGTSDLALADRKVSGNSVRCKRHYLLYHGTLLYDFPLAQISRYLAQPPRQPEYRQGRPHEAFVTNLPAGAAELRAALVEAWQADSQRDDWPQETTSQLAADKYSRPDWNLSL